MKDLAPIVLFVYNRPWHTRLTLEALSKNFFAEQSKLYIYSDGPKPNATQEQLLNIKEVRNLIREKKWCGEVEIVERDRNFGLADSVITGVTEIINLYKNVIVLEDDLVTSSGFLKYMNDAFLLYENHERVMHVSGYVYPTGKKLPETFFYSQTTCWGWGTWRRAWKEFNSDGSRLLLEMSQENIFKFNICGSYPFYELLKESHRDKKDSWAVRWYASVFLKGGLALHPNQSLVENIGNDGSGVHPHKTNRFHHNHLAVSINVSKLDIYENDYAMQLIARYFRGAQKKSFRNIIGNSVSGIIKRWHD